MTEILYVYGTLRPGKNDVVEVPGTLYDLGWFPGARFSETEDTKKVVVERIEVEDISAVDRYEGYNPLDPEMSLFVRKPFADGWVYEINAPVNPIKAIPHGDWLVYTQKERGVNGNRF